MTYKQKVIHIKNNHLFISHLLYCKYLGEEMLGVRQHYTPDGTTHLEETHADINIQNTMNCNQPKLLRCSSCDTEAQTMAQYTLGGYTRIIFIT